MPASDNLSLLAGAPIAGGSNVTLVANTAQTVDLSAFIGRALLFQCAESFRLLFGATTGMSAVTATTGPLVAANERVTVVIQSGYPFVSLLSVAGGALTYNPVVG
jgi:hypothetical protein